MSYIGSRMMIALRKPVVMAVKADPFDLYRGRTAEAGAGAAAGSGEPAGAGDDYCRHDAPRTISGTLSALSENGMEASFLTE